MERVQKYNTQEGWWEWVYQDAKEIGMCIESFDLYRATSDLKMEFEISFKEVAERIMASHGKDTGTWKAAETLMADMMQERMESAPKDPDYYNVMMRFLRKLKSEYMTMLKAEYEYLISDEVVLETIESMGWEFTEIGRFYEPKETDVEIVVHQSN